MVTRWLFLGCLLASFELAATQLTLKKQVYRGELPLLVEDLFVVKGEQADQIAKTPVDWQDADGWNENKLLLANVKEAGHKIEFDEKGKVWLSLCQPFDMRTLAGQVKSALSAQIDGRHAKVHSLKPMSNHSKCLPVNSQVIGTSAEFNGRFVGRVQSSHDLDNGKSVQQWWQVEFELLMGVAKKPIKRGEKLTSDNIEFKWQGAKGKATSKPIEKSMLSQIRASKGIAQGIQVTRNNSEEIPDVEKGEKVKLILVDGAITIETQAKALEQGSVDDIIQVLVAKAKGPVKGKIAGKGVVYAYE